MKLTMKKLRASILVTARAVDKLRERNEELEREILWLKMGLGGTLWRTQAGHSRWIALLSTPHLRNILVWPSTSDEAKRNVTEELQRRTIDNLYRTIERDSPRAIKADKTSLDRANMTLRLIAQDKDKAKRKAKTPKRKTKSKR